MFDPAPVFLRSYLNFSLFTACSLSLFMACSPGPTNPITPSNPTAVPSSSSPVIPSASPTVTISASPGSSSPPTSPVPTANPAAAASSALNLPNGTRLVVSLPQRFLSTTGESITLIATLFDAQGQALPLAGVRLIFSSSRPEDFSVSPTGLITALKAEGYSEIVVRVEGTDLSVSQLISVSSNASSGGGGGSGPTNSTSSPSPSPLNIEEDLNLSVEFEGLGFGEFRLNTYTTTSQLDSAIAMDDDGDYVITWQSNGQDGSSYGIYARRYSSLGIAQGSEFRVNVVTSDNQSNPDIAMDDDGDFVVTWHSYGQDGSFLGVYARRYDSLGTALDTSEFRVNTVITGYQSNPNVAMDNDGDFVITWQSNGQDGSGYGIYARRYDSQGIARDTSEFPVNTVISGDQRHPRVAMDSDGDFVITWLSKYQDGDEAGVYARRYDSQGIARDTSEFPVNTITENGQTYPDIAMDDDGDFVVTWQSKYQDNSDSEIYARRYNSQGLALDTSEFQVNTVNANKQTYPSIAIDSDGDFIVTWMSPDGSDDGIYARRYTSQGLARDTSELLVNTVTASNQTYPAIASDANGDFVVTWTSNDQENYGVYAQRFTALGQRH